MRPLVLAHRGASSYAPENTLPAFELALEMGADGIETDIRATGDEKLVLLHDERLDRTTDGAGTVASQRWDQVAELDAGSWFSLDYEGTRVPLLSDFLETYAGRTRLALEVKGRRIEPLVQAIIAPYVSDNLTVTSFQFGTILLLKRAMPTLRLGWLVRAFGSLEIELAAKEGLAQICPKAEGLSAPLVQLAHDMGLEVRAWAVNDQELMELAVQAGVDGMTINFPDKLVHYLDGLEDHQSQSA